MAQADEVALETVDVQEEVLIETERTISRKRRGHQCHVEIEKRHPATSLLLAWLLDRRGMPCSKQLTELALSFQMWKPLA